MRVSQVPSSQTGALRAREVTEGASFLPLPPPQPGNLRAGPGTEPCSQRTDCIFLPVGFLCTTESFPPSGPQRDCEFCSHTVCAARYLQPGCFSHSARVEETGGSERDRVARQPVSWKTIKMEKETSVWGDSYWKYHYQLWGFIIPVEFRLVGRVHS